MIHVEHWECEICGRQYDCKEDAAKCEARVTPKPFPVGLMFGDHSEGAFYKDITFAVAESSGLPNSHILATSSWACRDNGGDSLDDERCSAEPGRSCNDKLDPEHPTYKRMANYLRSRGITPTVVAGRKAVPIQ